MRGIRLTADGSQQAGVRGIAINGLTDPHRRRRLGPPSKQGGLVPTLRRFIDAVENGGTLARPVGVEGEGRLVPLGRKEGILVGERKLRNQFIGGVRLHIG